MLLEKDGLHRSVFRFLKVTQTNANQPITLLRTEINPLSQLQGDVRQFFAGGGWEAWRMAARENLELACLQLEDRPCVPSVKFFGEATKLFAKRSFSCSNQRQRADNVAADRDQPALAASGRCRQFFAGGGWGAWRMAASENLELACLQLEDNRACHP